MCQEAAVNAICTLLAQVFRFMSFYIRKEQGDYIELNGRIELSFNYEGQMCLVSCHSNILKMIVEEYALKENPACQISYLSKNTDL